MASDDSFDSRDFKDKKRKKELESSSIYNFPLKHGCEDNWSWSNVHRSYEVNISGTNGTVAHFHPNWSKGTAGVRGIRPLNNGRYYWELQLSERIFGTSMMFGIGTEKTRLHADSFINLLGEDTNSWGLSHKGVLWHGGVALMYTKRFKENTPTTIGILFNGIEGTLTYYKDGVCLGVAFSGLDKVSFSFYLCCFVVCFYGCVISCVFLILGRP